MGWVGLGWVGYLIDVDVDTEAARAEEGALDAVVVTGAALGVAERPRAVGAPVGAVDAPVAGQAHGGRGLFRSDDQRPFETDRLAGVDVARRHQKPGHRHIKSSW